MLLDAAWAAAVLATAAAQGVLQTGNFHFLVITMSLGAMLALERRRYTLGGALLAFAVVSKLLPGVLLAYLVVRRSWRAVAWTAGWMAVYAGATLALFGTKPYVAFLTYHLPRLASGDAFSFARDNIRPMTLNGSVMGLPKSSSRGTSSRSCCSRVAVVSSSLYRATNVMRRALWVAFRYSESPNGRKVAPALTLVRGLGRQLTPVRQRTPSSVSSLVKRLFS